MTTALRSAPKDGSNLGAVIQAYMRAHGVTTHAEVAAILGVDRTLVSKYVSGARRCHDVVQLRHFAKAMDLPPETFGLVAAPDDGPAAGSPSGGEAHQWRLVRQTLNRHRAELTAVAADLYWDPVRIAGTTCITRPDWMPAERAPLSAIGLSWRDGADAPVVVGNEPSSAPYRPHSPTGERYSRYSQAIRAIASPSLFENRASYRLLDFDWSSGGGRMSYGFTTYFDMVDVCEPLAHEVALAWLRRRQLGERVTLADLRHAR